MMIPESSLFSRINTMSRFMVLIFIASIILSLLFSSMISSAVLRPIKKLTQLMSRVEKGDFSVSVKVAGDNEIGALGHGFNTMISEINGLINKTIEFEVRNKESEYKALQSQINPHFLYNTLESIRMRCIVKKELELAEIINTLGSLFRLSIDRGERFAPLNDELEHVKSYMKIQNFRYEDKFSLNLHVPGDLLDCMVFKLMLQPLVENCIFHGLEMKPEDGRIDVRVKLVEEDLRIEIEDNGLGINEDTLRKLNDMLENREDYKTKQSIGLRNVHDRIRLFFGDPYGLQIESKEGSGTLITICMPAFKNERDIR